MLQPEDSKRVADAIIAKINKIDIVEAIEFAAKAFAGAKDKYNERFDTRIVRALLEGIEKIPGARDSDSLRFDTRVVRAIKEGIESAKLK